MCYIYVLKSSSEPTERVTWTKLVASLVTLFREEERCMSAVSFPGQGFEYHCVVLKIRKNYDQVVKQDRWVGEGQLAFLFTFSLNRTIKGHSFNWWNQAAAHSKQMTGNFTACSELKTLATDCQGRLLKQLNICVYIKIAFYNPNR